MRTTLNLPEELLKEAMRSTNTKTKTDAIIYALENVIKAEKIKKIKDYKGKLKLDINLSISRNR